MIAFANLPVMFSPGWRSFERTSPRRRVAVPLWCMLLFRCSLFGQLLPLPERSADALSGTEFAKSIATLSLPEREEKAYAQVFAGNAPPFLRHLCSVEV